MTSVRFGLIPLGRGTRKRELLQQMEHMVPWAELSRSIEPHWISAFQGHLEVATEALLRIHCMQLWFGLRDSAMVQDLLDVPLYMEFAGIATHVPDEKVLLEFRRMLQRHHLSGDVQRLINDQLRFRGLTLRPGTTVEAELALMASATRPEYEGQERRGEKSDSSGQAYFGV